ncbi:MAG: chemotaxis protein CheW [Desulfuromonadaceae bacterium]|nr:chemotaxis protein CheW [Desulfuromonas sp.]MDY0184599.1 chemotaxis protein CheW [Desulfuromonadaceae bacterium]
MSDIQKTLLPVFIEETELALEQIATFIQTYRDGTETDEIVELARRAAHTVKGTAALVKRFQTSNLAHLLEQHLDEGQESGDADIEKISAWYTELCSYLALAKDGAEEDTFEAAADSASDLNSLLNEADLDIINDFALPFMLKLHQAEEEQHEVLRPLCCRFFVGGRQYFISIKDVLEIYQYESVTYLPFAPTFVVGLLNIRGVVVPVVNLAVVDSGSSSSTDLSASYAVVATSVNGDVAFISDTIPQLSMKTAGHHIEVASFIQDNKVQA